MILMEAYVFFPPNRFMPIPNMDFSGQLSCQVKLHVYDIWYILRVFIK